MGWGPAQPKQHKVAGWEWDDHLSAHVASKPIDFACTCGQKIAAASGFNRCACGKQFNAYVIGPGGDRHEASADRYLVREVPVRDNVIVAGITKLTDPGEITDFEDDGTPTMKQPPSDWARRDPAGKWTTGRPGTK